VGWLSHSYPPPTKVGGLNADQLDGLDSSALQKRVSGACAAGTAVRVVNGDGSVSCQPVGPGNGWSLTGNAGTSPGANFLGTSDGQPLVVKTNGSEKLRVATNGNVGIGTTGPAAKLEADTASTAEGTVGVLGRVTSPTPGGFSAGVRGINAGTTGLGIGVWGSHAGGGWGVYGTSPLGIGIFGEHTSTSGAAAAIEGDTVSTADGAVGVLGQVTSTTPGWQSAAVRGINADTGGNGIGVWGSQAGYGRGVYGTSPNGTGVYGEHTSTSGAGGAVEGHTASTADYASGVFGYVHSSTPGFFSAGVRGGNAGTGGSGIGVYGSHAGSGWGVYGYAPSGRGVYGSSTSGIGVYGQSSNGIAGWFQGILDVQGDLNVFGGTKNFRIVHPLDPAHKYLQHAAIESNEVLNIYSGNVTTDGRGLATVPLPEWFDRINTDVRYQLTIVGSRGWNARVTKQIEGNRFTIETDQPNVQVSWQVTARRNDPYMRAHPFQVEQAKTGLEQGRYVTPEAYGRPASEGIDAIKPVPKPQR
jgi:hypothetical protein